MLFRLFALFWSIHLLSVTPTHALRFYVDPTTGDNRHSVQSAQDSATPFKTIAHALRIAHIVSESRPHVINIAGGTYSLSSGELFPLEITQTGIYIETTGLSIFDGENKTNFFKITGPTSDFLIRGIDFINGSAEKGGVAFCQTCSLRVADNRFFQNKASRRNSQQHFLPQPIAQYLGLRGADPYQQQPVHRSTPGRYPRCRLYRRAFY